MLKSNEHRTSKKIIGKHIIADFWDCDYRDNAKDLLAMIIDAANISNARILDTVYHQFEPSGSTALLLLAESHISLHTWPEYGYIAIDIFTCGHEMKPELAVEYLKKMLKPKRSNIQLLNRGQEKI